jgi:hypothetical protein
MMKNYHSFFNPSLVTAFGIFVGFCGCALTAVQAAPAHVTINAAGRLGHLAPAAFGMNTAVWDSHLKDPDIPGLLGDAGITALRWPGGSTSDDYQWSPADVNQFMTVADAAHAHVIFTVNYGSNAAKTGGGDPNEAAAWVDYVNNTRHEHVKYWEIGNEIYGNGEYGAKWEKDLHTSHSPTTYGTNCVQFITAMKAKDPTIKCGVVLAMPSLWPDGQKPSWNDNVLAACGPKIDFVIVHWYPQLPGKETDDGLLASTNQIAGFVAKTKALIQRYCGANAPHVQIFLTETNSVTSQPGKQTVSLVNALFLADDEMTWLENGVANVDWWCLHNGPPNITNNNRASLYGQLEYGDYGVLSSGQSPEPPVETPFPTDFALQMLASLAHPGDAMIPASSDALSLAVHATRNAHGQLRVLLINKDPQTSYTTEIALQGFTSNPDATLLRYGEDSTSIARSPMKNAAAPFRVTVPPYSMTVMILKEKSP